MCPANQKHSFIYIAYQRTEQEHVLKLRPCETTKREVGPKKGQKLQRIHYHHRADPNLYSVVKLRFPIKETHLGKGDLQLSLKCTASITDLYWRSTEVRMIIRPQHGWMFTAMNSATFIVGLQEHFHHLVFNFVIILAILN